MLKARTFIRIKLCTGDYDYQYQEWRLGTGIVEKLGFVKNLKIMSYTHTLPPLDLEKFPLIRNLKSIVVHFFIREDWQKDLCDKIILNSAPILEELKYEWYFHEDFSPCGGSTVFPKLKKLQLIAGLVQDPRPGNIQHEVVSQAITAVFPALKYLLINCNNLLDISKQEVLQ